MSDFITEQQRSIRARLEEIDAQIRGWEALHAEKRQLEALLGALGDPRPAADPRTVRPARAKPTAAGENERRLREALGDRPGATVAHLHEISGVSKATITGKLTELLGKGKVAKARLPGTRNVGWSLAEPGPETEPDTPDTPAAG